MSMASNATESEQPTLLRAIGPLMGIAVVVGTVLGSGIFKKPSSIAEHVPGFGWVAAVWILGGLLSLLGALALAEVAVLFPRSGGNYVFLKEGFGRLAGFLWGWVEFWIIRAASLAALATVFTESMHDVLRATVAEDTGSNVLTFWQERYLTIAVIVALAVVNGRGVKWGGGLQLLITIVKVGSLIGIMLLPLFFLGQAFPQEETPAIAASTSTSFTFGGLSTALVGVLWAYHGWMNLAWISGEVRQPQRNLPIAFILGVGTVVVLYLGVNLAYHLIIPQDEMARLGATTVATKFCLDLLGPVGGVVASAAVMCSVFGALNGNLLVGPRMLYAMGQDGLAPKALGVVHARFRTPLLAIAVLTTWSIVLIVAAAAVSRYGLPTVSVGEWLIDFNPPPNKSLFDILTDFVMFAAVLFETLAVTTIFVFRFRMPDTPRPYRCWGYPAVPLLYMILPVFILANMFVYQSMEAVVGLGFIGLGALVFVIQENVKNRSSPPTS